MPRVFDCVLIGEDKDLDLLAARMQELEDIPDVTHVIAETSVTWQGDPKPLHFKENCRTRFSPYHGRWTHVDVLPGELPQPPGKERKDGLREFLAHGLDGSEGDIILHGSVAEIPRFEVVRYLAQTGVAVPVALEMRLCAYRPGLVHPLPWRGTAACAYGQVPGSGFTWLREQRHRFPAITSAGTAMVMAGEPEQPSYNGKRLRQVPADQSWPRAWRTA
jgi:hypothetical protein